MMSKWVTLSMKTVPCCLAHTIVLPAKTVRQNGVCMLSLREVSRRERLREEEATILN